MSRLLVSTRGTTRLRLASAIWTRGFAAGRPGISRIEFSLAGPQLVLTYRSYAVSSSSPTLVTERFTLTEPRAVEPVVSDAENGSWRRDQSNT